MIYTQCYLYIALIDQIQNCKFPASILIAETLGILNDCYTTLSLH